MIHIKYIILLLLTLNCAAFNTRPKTLKIQMGNLEGTECPYKSMVKLKASQNCKIKFSNFTKRIKIEFTGFEFYQNEKNIVNNELRKSGFSNDEYSDILLEIILEEKEVNYEYNSLHLMNFLASIFSFSIVPFFNITEHEIKYRVSDSSGIVAEENQELLLYQYRGISLIPLMPFFWPSTQFEKSLVESFYIAKETK